MAEHDDLDLIRLFALSPEEASSLGLDAGIDGLPKPAEQHPAVPAPSAEGDGLDGSSAAALADREQRRMADELDLLAMLDSSTASRSPDYSGHGAARGLSLADDALPPLGSREPKARAESAPAPQLPAPISSGESGAGVEIAPGSLPPTPSPNDDSADADRFVWAAGGLAEEDDNVDVVSLFDLTAEEAISLGLAPSPRAELPDTPTASDTAPPGHETAALDVAFPTMHLHAVDEERRGERTAAGPVANDQEYTAALDTSSVEDDAQPAAVTVPVAQDVDTAAEPIAPLSSEHVEGSGQDDVVRAADTLAAAPPSGSGLLPAVDPALLDAFAEESAELLDGLHVELEHLEADVDDHGALLETRRIIHTIKGGAKMCGFEHVVMLTHSCENLLDLIADGGAHLDGPNLRALFDCEPLLRGAMQDALSGSETNVDDVAALAARFDAACSAAGGAPPVSALDDPSVAPAAEPWANSEVEQTSADSPHPPAAGAMREASDVQESAGEPIAEPSPGPVHPASMDEGTLSTASAAGSATGQPLPAPDQRPAGRRSANSISVDLSKVDAVVAKVTEMAAHRASAQGMIGQLLATSEDARHNVTRLHNLAMQISNECAGIQPEEPAADDLSLETYNVLNTLVLQLQEAVSDQQALVQAIHDTITSHWSLQATESRVDADLQHALMSIRLVPIANMRVRLDGVVRQAAEATGKSVRWQLQGSSVAVEKNVFDRLFEPLMHLLRNAVDHGIEAATERREAGKHEAGVITVTAAQEGNQIVITVADDGRGIVANKMAALAVQRGLITAEQANTMTSQQKMGLIFTPGFSTAATVSHLSGRGVGMDAVREACLRMGGSIDVSSRPGLGTTFTMRLPLSLSVTRGLIVRDGGCLMVMPVAQVVALHLVPASDVLDVPGGRVARIEGQELPIYNLPLFVGAVPAGYVQNGEVNVLQVTHEGGAIGVVIEDVLGEEEVLVKAVPALLRGVKTLLGAYVLPDGRVAPVVNLPQMLADLRPVATLTEPKAEREDQELVALVVDDSMSMRVALSGTLQSAGFTVLTARDGQEALDLLKREGLPSLVTLDVEMPRMDGLETLFAIRQMPGAQDLPVFMMTSRGGAKHRRAAEQLGATRYFTKPYRDSELATAARELCAHAPAS